eukprot:Lankesteria_metandrocarpae@DN5479_c0_g1_i12.p1
MIGQRELDRLDRSSIEYRVPPPGAKDEAGALVMHPVFPGLKMQYSVDGADWKDYDDTNRPSTSGERVYVRSMSRDGKRYSRVDRTSINPDNAAADSTANSFNLTYKFVSNSEALPAGDVCALLGGDWGSCATMEIELKNIGTTNVITDWVLYFHSIRRVLKVYHDNYDVELVTGDLNRIKLKAGVTPVPTITAGESLVLKLVVEYWYIYASDFFPNAYITVGDSKGVNILNSSDEDVSQYVEGFEPENYDKLVISSADNNVVQTPETRYERHKDVQVMTEEELSTSVVPLPADTTKHPDGPIEITEVSLGGTATLAPDRLAVVTAQLAELSITIGSSLGYYPINGNSACPSSQTYFAINIETAGATITACDEFGVFHAMQTFIGLFYPVSGGGYRIQPQNIGDEPRYGYRAFMLDVARNFRSVADVKALIHSMAVYKMNVLHFHLTDDEGWRLEIPGIPELTEVGSKRCHDLTEQTCLLGQLGSGATAPNHGTGYYTVVEFQDILKYADDRLISVVPEFDMPGHARAAVMAMEARYHKYKNTDMLEATKYRLTDPGDTTPMRTAQFYDHTSVMNPCLESTYAFIDQVYKEVGKIYDTSDIKLEAVHMGGDEVKNIFQGDGYTDSTTPAGGRGSVDASWRVAPFSVSPICTAFLEESSETLETVATSYFQGKVREIMVASTLPGVSETLVDVGYFEGQPRSALPELTTTAVVWNGSVGSSAKPTDNGLNRTLVQYRGALGSTPADVPADKYSTDLTARTFKVVIANADYVYCDVPHENHPMETGYYWASRATDERKVFQFTADNLAQNAELSNDQTNNTMTLTSTLTTPDFWEQYGFYRYYGLSGVLFSENVRTSSVYKEKVWPRLLAIAERAWHKPGFELPSRQEVEYSSTSSLTDMKLVQSDYQRFANMIGQRELDRLDKSSIQYRVPPPGAKNSAGFLVMHPVFPGLKMQYSVDGADWKDYDDTNLPLTNDQRLYVRSMSRDGKRYSRVDQIFGTATTTTSTVSTTTTTATTTTTTT